MLINILNLQLSLVQLWIGIYFGFGAKILWLWSLIARHILIVLIERWYFSFKSTL